jgi:hypothetical protein
MPPFISIIICHFPVRIIRHTGNYRNIMSILNKPFCHLTGVLSDTGQFRGIVDAIDYDSHNKYLIIFHRKKRVKE